MGFEVDPGGRVGRRRRRRRGRGRGRGRAFALRQHALSGSYDKTVKLFNVNDGTVLRTFTHHPDPVTCLALLPDGLRFVSGSEDETARIAYHGLRLR